MTEDASPYLTLAYPVAETCEHDALGPSTLGGDDQATGCFKPTMIHAEKRTPDRTRRANDPSRLPTKRWNVADLVFRDHAPP